MVDGLFCAFSAAAALAESASVLHKANVQPTCDEHHISCDVEPN